MSVGNPPIDLNGAGVRYAYACDQDNIMFEVEELDQPRFRGPSGSRILRWPVKTLIGRLNSIEIFLVLSPMGAPIR